MLIKSIDARNFRKYNKLIVSDIPESGVITISGSNESGKTSIGEAICFALFGRTFFLDERSLKKVICWGSDQTEVTLNFKTGEGEYYSIWRSVNRSGEVSVKLAKYDADLDVKENTSAIEDVEKVNQALIRLSGFDYDAFSNSFYLAQRELTSPDPHSQTIKQMAGIAGYAKITDDFEDDNQRNADTIAELSPQIEANQQELKEINLDETWLPELVDADDTLGKEQQGREKLITKLNQNEQLYTQNFSRFHGAKKASGIFGFLGWVLFPISLVLWLLWLANVYYPERFQEYLFNNLGEVQFYTFLRFSEEWLLTSAIVTLLVALLCWWMSRRSNNKMKTLNTEVKGLAGLLGEGHAYVTTLVETLMPERVVQLLRERAQDPLTLQVLPPREHFNNLTRLMGEAENYQADPDEMKGATDLLSEALKKQDDEVVSLSNIILEDIGSEKVRADKAGNLNASLQNLNKVIDKCNESIDTQTIAIGLMQRAAKDSVMRFNSNISKVSASTLPSFTQNRYSKIVVAQDFSIQIYSDEKQDFMDFDEVSSGTQRQVMLALRIAMSEQLSINSGNDEQFIFLDEPFAFFDQDRTKATLESLPKISNVLKQVWVCAQEFPVDAKIDKKISCPSTESELIV